MHNRVLSGIKKLSNYRIFIKFLDAQFNKEFKILETTIFEKSINNPIGLAAGFGKDGRVFKALFGIGFGFVEIGKVTPLAKLGNLKPRIFRLEKDQVLRNCLGFNNQGALEMSKKLMYLKNRIRTLKSKGNLSNFFLDYLASI